MSRAIDPSRYDSEANVLSRGRLHLRLAVAFFSSAMILAACATDDGEDVVPDEAVVDDDEEAEADPPDDTDDAVDEADDDPLRTVTVGVDTSNMHEAIYMFMEDYCTAEGYGIQVETVPTGPRFFDRVVLLEQQDIDVAVSGYNTVATIMEQGLSVVAVAGHANGLSDLVVGAEHEVQSWEDLVGLRIGVPTGSLVEHQVLIGLESAGVSADQVDFEVMFPGPQATIALVRGDLDAIGGWEAWPSTVVAASQGYIPFDYQESELGPINALIQTHTESVGESWLEEFVACLIDAGELFNTDEELAVEAFRDWSGLADDVARHALRRTHYDANMYLPNLQTYAGVLYDYELTEIETTDMVEDGLDYSILEAVTGDSRDNLGYSTRAVPGEHTPERDPSVYDYDWRPFADED